MDGKVLLETKSRLPLRPTATVAFTPLCVRLYPSNDKTRTVLSDLESRKVLYVHAYCVDNCLVRVADPVFVGYGISKQADCAAKVVPKAYPNESVGVVARRDGKYNVVEYSEISTAQAEARDATTGELLFRAGNIANHFYSTAFLRGVAAFEEDLAFHIARKKIPHVPPRRRTRQTVQAKRYETRDVRL
jgi:UDP-N-acetylglucosamine/UDP-N-acetylgalactosamine diphosphorylase